MIKRDSIDKLLDIVQIEDVVGDYVNLKRRGANYIGLCPFHDEKTPSFSVSATKGIYKCFGCGESGNAVGFVMANEQMSFVEAVRLIAQKYNFELEETEDTAQEKQVRDEKEAMYIVTKFAQEYYTNNLLHSDIGKAVGLSYFKQRGFTTKTIENFGLGFAFEGFDNLLKVAKEKKYDVELLKKTGLVSEKNDKQFDFFRDRVMFPIHSATGKVIAFAGRTLKSDKKIPKYINSAETDIYSKSFVLYGMYQAKKTISKQDNCFLVEGYTDVISLHQAGVENVVASSGTSLTQGQIKLIKRYTKNITLLFDGDQAGIKAALRGVDLVLPEDVNVRVVPLPEEHDPDSFIQELGFEAFTKYAEENTVDFIIFKLKTLLGENPSDDPIKKAEATREIVQSIALIPDSIKRSFYVKECSNLLKIEEQILHIEVNKSIRSKLQKDQKLSERDRVLENKIEESQIIRENQGKTAYSILEDKNIEAEKKVIKCLLNFAYEEWEEGLSVLDYVLFELEEQTFLEAKYQKILQLYRDTQGILQLETTSMISDYTTDKDFIKSIIDITLSKYVLSNNWLDKHEIKVDHEGDYLQEIDTAIHWYKSHKASMIKYELEDDLKHTSDIEEQLEKLAQIKLYNEIIIESNREKNWNNPILGKN